MWETLETKKYSHHPDDSFLEIHLRKWTRSGGKIEYTVHGYNSQVDGHFQGNYYDNLADARRKFNERGV